MHENIIKAFPVPELNGSSVPTSTRRLSSYDVKRIEGEIKRLEDWNARFLKRAIEYLFFGQIHTPSASERERIIHSYEALDRVINLRKAVRESLTEATLPSKLLLDEDPERPPEEGCTPTMMNHSYGPSKHQHWSRYYNSCRGTRPTVMMPTQSLSTGSAKPFEMLRQSSIRLT